MSHLPALPAHATADRAASVAAAPSAADLPQSGIVAPQDQAPRQDQAQGQVQAQARAQLTRKRPRSPEAEDLAQARLAATQAIAIPRPLLMRRNAVAGSNAGLLPFSQAPSQATTSSLLTSWGHTPSLPPSLPPAQVDTQNRSPHHRRNAISGPVTRSPLTRQLSLHSLSPISSVDEDAIQALLPGDPTQR